MVLTAYFGWMIYPLLYDGPVNATIIAKNDACKSEHWMLFVYIFNLFPIYQYAHTQPCIGWVWYLANDFQFYLISPLFIVAYRFKKWVGYLTCSLVILASMALNYTHFYLYKATPTGAAFGAQSGAYCVEAPVWYTDNAKKDRGMIVHTNC